MATNKQEAISWISDGGKEISENVLLKLYEIHEEEHIASLDLHYKNRNYYMTLVSALLAIFVGGVLQFYKEPSSFIIFVIPISIGILSELAKKTMDRYYQRFLESVVILAKIEHLWGIDGSLKTTGVKSSKVLWVDDKQFVLDRWIKDRYKHGCSQQFINERMKMGDNRYAHWVFTILEVITAVLALLSLWILLQVHLN